MLCDSCMMAHVCRTLLSTIHGNSHIDLLVLWQILSNMDSFVTLYGLIFLSTHNIHDNFTQRERKRQFSTHFNYYILDGFSFFILKFLVAGFFALVVFFLLLCSSFKNICIWCWNCFMMWHNNFVLDVDSPNNHTLTIYFTLIEWHSKCVIKLIITNIYMAVNFLCVICWYIIICLIYIDNPSERCLAKIYSIYILSLWIDFSPVNPHNNDTRPSTEHVNWTVNKLLR